MASRREIMQTRFAINNPTKVQLCAEVILPHSRPSRNFIFDALNQNGYVALVEEIIDVHVRIQ
jgi:hypothetical protein